MFLFVKEEKCERIEKKLDHLLITRIFFSHTCLAFCYGMFLFSYELKFFRDLVSAIHPALIGWAGVLAVYDVLVRRIWKRIPFYKPLLLFVVAALVTALLNRETGIAGDVKSWILAVLPLFAFLPVFLLADKDKRMKTFVTALLGVAVIACVASAIAVVMYVNRVNQSVTFLGITDTVGFRYYYAGGPSSAIILYGVYTDTNHASLYALAMIAYSLFLLNLCLKNCYSYKWQNILGGLFAIVNILVQSCYFPLANSRGSWLSLCVAMLITTYFYAFVHLIKRGETVRRSIISLMLAGVVVGASCVCFLGCRKAMSASAVWLEQAKLEKQFASESSAATELIESTESVMSTEPLASTELVTPTEPAQTTEASALTDIDNFSEYFYSNLSSDGSMLELRLLNADNYENVWFPVWSEHNDQDDIQWYLANKQTDGSFIANIDIATHGETGTYIVHVYGGSDQPEELLTTATVEVPDKSCIYLENASGFSATLSSDCNTLELVLKDAGGYENVWFPVWSVNNDQDDLQWYPARKLADGSFMATADMTVHGEAGTYVVHVYGGSDRPEKMLIIAEFVAHTTPTWSGDSTSQDALGNRYDEFTKFNADFGAGRIDIWKDTLKLFSYKPIMGQGPGNISYYAAMYSPDGVIAGGKVDVHNSYLDLLLDYGVVGFALLMSFWVMCVICVLRSIYVEKRTFELQFFLCAFIVLMTACGAFLLSCTFINTTAMYFLMLISTSYLLAECQGN